MLVQQASFAQVQAHEQFIEESVRRVFDAMDDNESGFVSWDEFQTCSGFEAARDFLKEMDIRPEDSLALFDMMDDDSSGQIDIEGFIVGCKRFSGTAKNFDMAVALNTINQVPN